MSREELILMEKEEIIEILLSTIEELTATIIKQAEIIQLQVKEIEELKARLKQNSKNSSKPPSSDGFNKPKSLRKPSGKKAGGQEGHEGSGFKLTEEPDNYVKHEPHECINCQKSAECQANQTVNETRYEIDIVIKTNTTAHQAMQVKCPQTEEILTGCFPGHINSTIQYGVNIEALAVTFNTYGMVSVNRTHEILSGIFGVPISTGTISAMVSESAEKVAGTVQAIKEALLLEPVIHNDETGTRVDKKTIWAHVASTAGLTYIEVHTKRGKEGMDAIGILPEYRGTSVHDCWIPYFSYVLICHALCNAHLLRELTAVLENAKQAWAQELIDLLLAMKMIKETLLLQGIHEANPEIFEECSRSYDAILAEALEQNPVPVPDGTTKGKPKRGKTGALVDRLIRYKEQYLLFFTDFIVPFDNNQAERDFRLFKVKQKISGCFRTMEGAKDFAAIMSFISTAHKKGISAFNAIKDALLGNPFSIA